MSIFTSFAIEHINKLRSAVIDGTSPRFDPVAWRTQTVLRCTIRHLLCRCRTRALVSCVGVPYRGEESLDYIDTVTVYECVDCGKRHMQIGAMPRACVDVVTRP
mgnify:CR=1 FL=1